MNMIQQWVSWMNFMLCPRWMSSCGATPTHGETLVHSESNISELETSHHYVLRLKVGYTLRRSPRCCLLIAWIIISSKYTDFGVAGWQWRCKEVEHSRLILRQSKTYNLKPCFFEAQRGRVRWDEITCHAFALLNMDYLSIIVGGVREQVIACSRNATFEL